MEVFGFLRLDNVRAFVRVSVRRPSEDITDIVDSMFSAITTVYLMTTIAPTPEPTTDVPQHVRMWATLLGVTSSILAMVQYTPQLIHTYRLKLVGVLSIPMMCITVPGSVLMITGIAFRQVKTCVSKSREIDHVVDRPGTNWTNWLTYLVAGVMQGGLLVLCIVWKYRQDRLGIDDFGNGVLVERTVLIRK